MLTLDSSYMTVKNNLNETLSAMNSESSDSGQWGLVSNEEEEVEDEQLDAEDEHKDEADVHIVNVASFLTDSSDSFLKSGQLIVDGVNRGDMRNDDDDRSEISLDLSMPDTESLPTDVPTLSVANSEDYPNAEGARGGDLRHPPSQHQPQKPQVPRMWILMVGILSTISAGSVVMNVHQGRSWQADRMQLKKDIDELERSYQLSQETSAKRKTEMSAVLFDTISSFTVQRHQWNAERTLLEDHRDALKEAIFNLEDLNGKLEGDKTMLEEDAAKLEAEIRILRESQTHLEEQVKTLQEEIGTEEFINALAVQRSSNSLSIVNNCWVKAEADFRLGTCADEALGNVHKAFSNLQAMWWSAITGTTSAILPKKAISGTSSPTLDQDQHDSEDVESLHEPLHTQEEDADDDELPSRTSDDGSPADKADADSNAENKTFHRWTLKAINGGKVPGQDEPEATSSSDDGDSSKDDERNFYDKAEKALDTLVGATEKSLNQMAGTAKEVLRDASAAGEAASVKVRDFMEDPLSFFEFETKP